MTIRGKFPIDGYWLKWPRNNMRNDIRYFWCRMGKYVIIRVDSDVVFTIFCVVFKQGKDFHYCCFHFNNHCYLWDIDCCVFIVIFVFSLLLMDCFSLSFLLRFENDDFGLINDEEWDTVTVCSVDVSLSTNMLVMLSRLLIRRKTCKINQNQLY